MKMAGVLRGFFFIFTAVLGMLFLIPPAAAQVNQSELENLEPVLFINYEGPHSRIETRAQIRSIGYDLGLAIGNGAARTGALGRYFVIHSVSESDGIKLDADIFGLGPDVGVDHVRNLRTIIQGYLEAAYSYTQSDAALLAEYITIYNAVYRGDWTYFSSRYKNPVMSNLNREKAGLSLRYDEWPGQTLILIPIGSGLGGALSSIDTSAINDSRVIEQMRQEPDMSLEQRRDMVDLMEREADQAGQQAAIAREGIQQEEQRIAQERAQAQQQQQEAQRAQQQIEQERQQPGADQQALDERQQAAEQQALEARQQQEELDRRQEELEAQRETAERQEEFAEQRMQETQQQRQQIAEDQQSVINRPPDSAQAGGIFGVSILNSDSPLGQPVLLDNSGRVIRQSPLNTVNARTVTFIGNRVFAIAGENRGSGAIRLVEIDAATLEMQAQGEDDIVPQSLLWTNGQDLYAVVSSGENRYLARFSQDLLLQMRSTISVHPFASVLFSDGLLLTQRDDGSALVLDPGILVERR